MKIPPFTEALGEDFACLYLRNEDTLFGKVLADSLAWFFSKAENKLSRAQEPKSRWDFEFWFSKRGYRMNVTPRGN